MPQVNGYSIYVAAPTVQRAYWIVRAFRDSDDQHIWSAEDCSTLSMGLREVERKITEDVNASLAEARA